MTMALKIGKLDKIVDKYNKSYLRTIKMKLADVKPSSYIGNGVEHNHRDTKFNAGDHVRISKYKNTSCKKIRYKQV